MPRFAPFCHFRYIFNNLYRKSKPRKSRQNTANRGILGRRNNMISILFVCHGNICRSPMSEFIMKDLVSKQNLAQQFFIASAATSTEEIWNGIGNPVYPPARDKLKEHGISCGGKRAVQLKRTDYGRYDYLIGMDSMNIRNMHRMLGGDPEGKIFKLLSFAGVERDISDPWYTGDFDATYRDVLEGCTALLAYLREKGKIDG